MKTKTNKMTEENIKTKKENKGSVFKGVIVSDKMNKTVVVAVSKFIKHPKYGKYYKVTKNTNPTTKKINIKQGKKWP